MSAKLTGMLLVLLLVAGIATVFWLGGKGEPQEGKPNGGSVDSEIHKLRDDALRLQQEKKWCEAKQQWDNLKAKLSDSVAHGLYHEEADRNLNIVASNCDESTSLVSERKIPELPKNDRPEEVSEKDIVSFYPEGRAIQSIALVNVTGTGVNKQWIFQGNSHFAYQYRIELETRVMENRGTAVVFRQSYRDVSQLRAVSDQSLELNLPESPILNIVWDPLEKNVLEPIPAYRVLKKAKEVIETVDPRFKRTLSYFHNQLKRFGAPLDNSDDVEIVTMLDKLAGIQLELEYVSGWGVSSIKVLGDKQFDPNDLDRLAYNSSLFMDYFFSNEKDGESFTIRAKDMGGMLNFGYDTEVKGDLSFIQQPNSDPNADTTLTVAGGEVTINGSVAGINRTGHLKPKGGTVRYSPKERLVREARMSWQADTNWITTDHLLFGTEKIRNLNLETYYEAREVKANQAEHTGQ